MERRRAVALARHYREVEGLSIRQIAERLSRSPATVKGYFYDPTGEKARAVKARYVGFCRGCGAYTHPRNGNGDAYPYCKRCHPGAIQRRWTRERVVAAMLEWRERYGRLPTSYDWSRTHARRRGGEALERLAHVDWAATSVKPYPVHDHRGKYQESVLRNAFAEATSGRDTVALRVEHSRDLPPLASTKGGSLSYRDSDEGLAMSAVLPKHERDVSDAVSTVRRGVLDGLSVGMGVDDDSWSSDGGSRTIHSARLYEVSLVHQGANPAAIVTGVRAGREDDFEVRVWHLGSRSSRHVARCPLPACTSRRAGRAGRSPRRRSVCAAGPVPRRRRMTSSAAITCGSTTTAPGSSI